MMHLMLAVEGGNDLLTHDFSLVQQTYRVWEQIWINTFTSFTSGSAYYLLNYIASFIAAIGTLFWLAKWARDLAYSSNWWEVAPRFIWVLAVLIFMSNHGQRLADLSMGIHALINSWQQGVLQGQINGVSLQTTLSNQLATAGLKDAVSQLVQQCNQLPAPSVAIPSLVPPADLSSLTPAQQQVYAKLACYQIAAQQAQQLQQQYQQTYCLPGTGAFSIAPVGIGNNSGGGGLSNGVCPGLSRFVQNVLAAEQKATQNAGADIGSAGLVDFSKFAATFANVALTSAIDAIIKQILYSMQWLFANLWEMGEWLTALSGPIALATSIMPMESAGLPVWGWLISFFSFGLMQIYYVIILGITASLIAGAQTETLNDLSFAFLLGFFAPLIAMSLATGGAYVAIRGMTRNGSQILQAGAGLASTVVTSIVSLVAPFL